MPRWVAAVVRTGRFSQVCGEHESGTSSVVEHSSRCWELDSTSSAEAGNRGSHSAGNRSGSWRRNDLRLAVIQNLYRAGQRRAVLIKGHQREDLPGQRPCGEWRGSLLHWVCRDGPPGQQGSACRPNATGGALQKGFLCGNKSNVVSVHNSCWKSGFFFLL